MEDTEKIQILGEGDAETLAKVTVEEQPSEARDYSLGNVEGERGLLDGVVKYAKALRDYQKEKEGVLPLSISFGRAQDVSEPGKEEYNFRVAVNEGVKMSHDELSRHAQRIYELAQGNKVVAQIVTSKK